jgi:2-keto-4-pentenoate hydratase/2-oxohepta-3-ene-1,7-dioic acid hydratase in catechol pathway
MRLTTYEHDGAERLGVVDDEGIHPLADGTDLLELLMADVDHRDALVDRAREPSGAIDVDEVRLRAPIRPNTFRDFVCFEQHVEGIVKTGDPDAKVMPDWYDAPTFYFTNSAAIFGPGDEIEVPPGCELLDFELEIAAVIGRAGRDVHPEHARDHIAAFTIYNDWSARDHGAREVRMGLGWAKAKDFANTLGPWLVTADELDPHRRGDRIDLELIATRNGLEIGRDSLANMAWSFEEMVAYASRGTWLHPGDVLGSGTCGSGCLAELWGRNGRLDPRPLAPGDEVTLSAQGIGTLTNRVVEGVEPVPLPRARPRGVTA